MIQCMCNYYGTSILSNYAARLFGESFTVSALVLTFLLHISLVDLNIMPDRQELIEGWITIYSKTVYIRYLEQLAEWASTGYHCDLTRHNGICIAEKS